MTGVLIKRGGYDTVTQEGRPGEDTGRRQPSISQGERLQRKPTLQHLDFRLQVSRTVRK